LLDSCGLGVCALEQRNRPCSVVLHQLAAPRSHSVSRMGESIMAFVELSHKVQKFHEAEAFEVSHHNRPSSSRSVRSAMGPRPEAHS
jgi:hypothetical protein